MPAPDVTPPVFYVPCTTDASGGFRATLRRTNDGRVALLVYTALDRLLVGAGDVPWAVMSVADLGRLREESPFDVIYQDLRIPTEHREPTA